MGKSEEHLKERFSIREGPAYSRGEYVNKSPYKSNIVSGRRIKMRRVIVGLVLFLGIVSTSCGQSNLEMIFVDDAATGANNGTSWDNAYKSKTFPFL